MTNPQIEERPEQSYLGIRCEITEGVRAAVDRAFPQLFGWLGNQGVQPSGPPFIRYHEVDESGEPRLIEVGVPVVAHQEGDDPVRADALPAGRYVTALHIGPYTHDTVPDLGHAREALRAWTDTNGLATGFLVEHYRIRPPMESDWTRWETELAYLILDA